MRFIYQIKKFDFFFLIETEIRVVESFQMRDDTLIYKCFLYLYLDKDNDNGPLQRKIKRNCFSILEKK